MCPRRRLMTLTKNEVFPSSLLGPSTRLPFSAGPLGETKRGNPSENTGHLICLLWLWKLCFGYTEGWFTMLGKGVRAAI